MDPSLHQRIRERAFEIWSVSGGMHGQAEQHWLAAEHEILGEMAAQLAPLEGVKRPMRTQRKVAAQRRKRA